MPLDQTIDSSLESALGKSIDRICPNSFHDLTHNHCAHFVSHMLGFDFSFTCREFKGGSKAGGNIRVHELFARCPRVGPWDEAPLGSGKPLIAFVTRRDVVDVGRKMMENIPQKHVGIYHDGHIYHYSNTPDKVVKWTPEKFLEVFEGVYDGRQGLFFGTLPGSDLHLSVQAAPVSVQKGRKFQLVRDGKDWTASAGGEPFTVGREFRNPSADYTGLFIPSDKVYGPRYSGDDYVDHLDHWAYLLELSGHCESKNRFNTINTYDSAKFTFGFYQLAAHTAGDNLILLMHRLAELPEFADYFPELKVVNGRLHRVDGDGGATDLEEEMATGPNGRRQPQLFMNFLNAKLREHDLQEVLMAARMIHWANTSPAHRAAQVAVANAILQRKMDIYQRWYDLDGRSDVICALVADIHHQGRAKRSAVEAALASADPEERLITINPSYAGRIRDLRAALGDLRARGKLGTRKLDAAAMQFV